MAPRKRKQKHNRKRKRDHQRTPRLLNAIANLNRTKREIEKVSEKIEKGVTYNINGLDVTDFWLSTVQARQRSENYRRKNDE